MHRMRWLGLVGVLACVGVAAAQTITFEAPTYSPAALVGQDGWAQNLSADGSFAVITGDNGPSISGSQCLEVVGPTANAWRVFKAIPNLVPPGSGDKLITFEYDFKYVNYPSGNGIDFRVRLMDSPSGLTGIAGAHSDVTGGTGFTWYGSWHPSGTPLAFAGEWAGAPNLIPNPTQWNRIKFVYYYGTGTGGAFGQLMYIEVNGSKIYALDCWGIAPANDIDTIQLRALPRNPTYIVRIDNLRITVANPTGMPIANAGPDQNNVPSTYDGAFVDLDGTASADPGGALVFYRWTVDGSPPAVKVQGATASAPQDVPVAAAATTTLRLAVIDNDGLQSTDTVNVTTLPPTPIPIDTLAGPFATKNGDNFGTAQHPLIVPAGGLQFQLITLKQGGPFGFAGDGVEDRQLVFDDRSNSYRVQWYRKVCSVDPDFNLRWESVEIGGPFIKSTAVLVGERYLYVVGSGGRNSAGQEDSNARPSLWAFNKVNGQVVWRIELRDALSGVQEPIPSGDFSSFGALHNNKVYVVGLPFDSDSDGKRDSVRIFRIDVGTDVPGPVVPNVDWGRIVSWGTELPRFGNMVVIPTGGPANEVVLAFAGRSAAPDDGLADVVGVRVNDSGVVSSWGVDGALCDLSAVTYSPTTGQLYVRSQSDNWGNIPQWRINPFTGVPATTQVQGDTTSQTKFDQEAVALSFSGTKVHSGGFDGWVYSYTDNGTQLLRGGAKWAAFGFTGNNAALIRNTAGDDIMITAFQDGRWWIPWVNPPAPDGSTRQFSRIVALNLTQAATGVPGEAEIDDGPIYFDNVKVLRNNVVVFEEDFQSYPVGPLSLPNAKWISTSDPGAPTPQIVLEGTNKVLALNPFGGNSFQYVGLRAALTLPTPQDGDVIKVQWQQRRVDLTDNGGVITSASVPGSGALGVFLWDGAGNPASQKAYATGANPNWSPTAGMAVSTWQTGELTYEYLLGLGIAQQDLTIAGTNDGQSPSLFEPVRLIDRVELWYQATPPTSSGWTPPTNQPLAEYVVNADYFSSGLEWAEPDGLSIAPNGDIYFMQFGDNFQRRWWRLRLVGTGPVLCPGDMDCNGQVDFDDIDRFVEALGYPGGVGWPHACPWLNGDCNGDSQVDFDDIDAFVARIGASCN